MCGKLVFRIRQNSSEVAPVRELMILHLVLNKICSSFTINNLLQIKECVAENKDQFYIFCEKMWMQLGRPWNPTKYQKNLLDISKDYQSNGGNFG